MGATPEKAGEVGREAAFRWRGGSVSRIEGLTDGVFALALTLLVVTLEVPTSYGAMIDAFAQVPVFALTFASIGLLWYQHHLFHRRYGLEDIVTVVWNLVFLFLVLLYAYPLKFLARALCQMSGLVPHDSLPEGFVAEGLEGKDVRGVMLLYSGGVVAIFLVLAAMVRHAEKRADDLGLDARERILTRSTLRDHLLAAGIGGVSFLLAAASPGLVSLSGMLYFLFGPLLGWNGWRTDGELRALEAGEGGGGPS
jgi:hypothetical protein